MNTTLQTPDEQRADLQAKLAALGGGTSNSVALPAVAQSTIPALGSIGAAPGSPGGGIPGLSQVAGKAGGLSGVLGGLGQGIGALGGLASIYQGFQAQKLAKKAFKFQKGAYNNNLINSTQSYNTELGDRIAARHNTEGRSQAATDQYNRENRLQANTL